MHRTNFKVIKGASWGIVIEISGSYVAFHHPGKIELNLDSIKGLNQEEVTSLYKAIDLVEDQVLKILGEEKCVRIEIMDIQFNPCDYQVEGLTWALVQWCNEVLGTQISYSRLSFNKITNRYEFVA